MAYVEAQFGSARRVSINDNPEEQSCAVHVASRGQAQHQYASSLHADQIQRESEHGYGNQQVYVCLQPDYNIAPSLSFASASHARVSQSRAKRALPAVTPTGRDCGHHVAR